MKKIIRSWKLKIRQYLTEDDEKQKGRLFLFSLLVIVLVSCIIILGGYGIDYVFPDRTSRKLQTIYDAAATAQAAGTALPEITTLQPAVPETDTASNPFPVSEMPSDPASPEISVHDLTEVPDPVMQSLLPENKYPDNPDAVISDRFLSLREENKDIVGWLTIDQQLNEVVVQRDHVYYLDHDALPNQNVNGAIFLDAAVKLNKGRPYSLILYGHNMKTGRMFGWLRNYENIRYYHKNPWVHFNTIYEDGKYVVFAAGIISTTPGAENYLDVYSMTSGNRQKQLEAINTLLDASVHTCSIDVAPSDQLLLLVTCVDTDDERRVVAARRIREGENEEDLLRLVNYSHQKNVRFR